MNSELVGGVWALNESFIVFGIEISESLIWAFLTVCFIRVYGCDDIELGVRLPEHILEEGHEGEVCQWNELLCLSIYFVSHNSHALRHCGRRTTDVGCWMGKGRFSNWTTIALVKLCKPISLYCFLS